MNRKTMKYRVRKTIIDKGDDQPDILKRILYSDTLLVIVLTGFSYILFFLFDLGYLLQFGLPITYISFDMIQIILLVCLSIGVYVAILEFNFPVVYLNRRFGHIVSFENIYFFFAYLVVLFIIKIIYWENWIIVVSLYVFLIFFILLSQRIFRRVREIFGSRSSVPKADLSLEENSFLGAYFSTIKLFGRGRDFKKLRILTFLLSFFPTVTLCSYSFGILMARTETSFYVVNDTTECAVLYRKADRYLCAPFDRAKKEVEPAFRLLYYQDNQNLELRKENIGPLHLKPTPTPTPKPTFTPTVTRTPPPTDTPTSTAEIPRFQD